MFGALRVVVFGHGFIISFLAKIINLLDRDIIIR